MTVNKDFGKVLASEISSSSRLDMRSMKTINDEVHTNPYDFNTGVVSTEVYSDPEPVIEDEPHDNIKINKIAIGLGRKELFNNIKDDYQIGKMKSSDKAHSYPEFCEIALLTDKIPRNVSYNELLDYFRFELYEVYNKTAIR